ncbi:MAG: hypothetical protein LLF92_06500 [Planctomycetaceae bacterium]|nr:hypothetical protein [Planctomycetaceae bacterium]
MTTKETNKMAKAAQKTLRKAVVRDFQRKALLGQYVVINQNGKTRRISAREALKIAKKK